MAYVNFVRGIKSNYLPTSDHLDAIYFATDTYELLMNNVAYGVGSAVSDIAYNQSSRTFTITFAGNASPSSTTIELPEATTSIPGLMTATDKQNLETALETILDITNQINISGSEAITVSGTDSKTIALTIDSSDTVLSLSASGLLANINLTWDTTNGLKLIGKDSTEIATIPASDFIKDGMLDTVELLEATTESPVNGLTSGTYIIFTFNTDAGSKVIYLDVTDLIDVYTAGNGIEVSGKEISVKVASGDEGFLRVSADGVYTEGILDAIQDAVEGVVSGDIDAILNYTINGYRISDNPTLNGADIALTGYTGSEGLIEATDTVNTAILKLDQKLVWNEV